MRVWEDLLTEHDRKVIAGRPARQLAGFGDRPALIVIDMNAGAVGEDGPIYEHVDRYPGSCGNFAWAAIPHQQKILSKARKAGIPVVYSRHVFRAIHDLPRAKDPTFQYSELNTQSEIHPEVAMGPGDLLIEKQRASVFFQTGLIYTLLNKKVDSLIIIGNSTSGCVRATVIDGAGYAFKVSVVEECVFDRIEMSHKASLFDMQFKYCDVNSVDEVCDFLATVRDGEVTERVNA